MLKQLIFYYFFVWWQFGLFEIIGVLIENVGNVSNVKFNFFV